MKIYTNTIDLATPSEKKFWVAPYSDFAIGIKFLANGEAVEGDAVLKDRDGNEMTAETEKYGDGFTVFKTSSGEGEKTDVYKAVAPNGQEVIIIQNTSDSTVFDIDEAGTGVPENLETKSVVTNALSVQALFEDEPAFDFYVNAESDIVAEVPNSGMQIYIRPQNAEIGVTVDQGDEFCIDAKYMPDGVQYTRVETITDDMEGTTERIEEYNYLRPITLEINGKTYKVLAEEITSESDV